MPGTGKNVVIPGSRVRRSHSGLSFLLSKYFWNKTVNRHEGFLPKSFMGFLTLHSFTVTLFTLGTSSFFILLQNKPRGPGVTVVYSDWYFTCGVHPVKSQ
jgi:hypothetical protein